jgi:hypothetical protein
LEVFKTQKNKIDFLDRAFGNKSFKENCGYFHYVGFNMRKRYKERIIFEKLKKFFVILAIFIILFLNSNFAYSAELSNVNVKIQNNEIYVSTTLIPDKKFLDDLGNGISKEITFFIDLFRIWKIWPDEFVTGIKITRILRSDNIREEYVVKNISGNIRTERRFRNVDSMVEWAVDIRDLKLSNIKEFESGEYYVKVTVESSIKKLPPVIGYLLFFIPEKEFSISKKSVSFRLGKDEGL